MSADSALPRRPDRPSAWRRPAFRRLTLAWLCTNVADSALLIMLAVWVKDLTGSDPAAASVFALMGAAALTAPFLGQLADRTRRRPLLVAANLTMAGLVAVLLVVRDAGAVWLVFAVVVVYAAAGYLTAAAQSGLVRDLLPDDELASGNGLLATIDQTARLLAPALGTVLYLAAGPHAVVVVTAAAFAAAGLALLAVRVVESVPEPAARGGYLADLAGGVRHLFGSGRLGILTVVLAVAVASTGIVNITVFPALEHGFRMDAAWLGVLESAIGGGALLGGLTAARIIGRLGEERTTTLGVTAMAVAALPLVGGSFPLLLAGAVLLGVGVSWAVVAYTTLRQRATPPRLQGRVSAASNVLVNVPQMLVTAGAAALLGVADYRWLVAGMIAALAAAAFAGAVTARLDRTARTARTDAPAGRNLPIPATGTGGD